MISHKVQLRYRVLTPPDESCVEELFSFFYYHGGGITLCKTTSKTGHSELINFAKFDNNQELFDSFGRSVRSRLDNHWIEQVNTSHLSQFVEEVEGHAVEYHDEGRFGVEINRVIRDHFGDKVTLEMMQLFEQLPMPQSKLAVAIKAAVDIKISEYPDSWGTW